MSSSAGRSGQHMAHLVGALETTRYDRRVSEQGLHSNGVGFGLEERT